MAFFTSSFLWRKLIYVKYQLTFLYASVIMCSSFLLQIYLPKMINYRTHTHGRSGWNCTTWQVISANQHEAKPLVHGHRLLHARRASSERWCRDTFGPTVSPGPSKPTVFLGLCSPGQG